MINSKQKGARFERQLAGMFRDYGFQARRTAQYCGNTGDASDVIGLPGIHIEAKHQETMRLYDWMAQAVSDLSAANAPSLALWNQLSALYNACEVVCTTVVCIGIQGQKTRLLRVGVYLFAVMEWVSAIGYRVFPLSDSGYAGAFQDVMHMAVTALVVLLSIVSLTVIITAGAKSKACRSYGVCAAIALDMMLVGAVGMKLVPPQYFSVVERFSVFAATGFNAALGIHLFREENAGETQNDQEEKS